MSEEKKPIEQIREARNAPIGTTPDAQKTDPAHSDFLRRDRWWESFEPKGRKNGR